MKTLRPGHRGPDVAHWQRFLQEQNHAPGSIDGIFGPKTAAATRRFQAAHELVVDAIVGPRTQAKAAELGLRMFRRVMNSELSPALISRAKRVLAAHRHAPYGSEFPFEQQGLTYIARIEEHYHPPGGPRKPWGYHPGVSLLVEVVPDSGSELPDEAIDPPGSDTGLGGPADPVASRATVVLDPGHGGSERVGHSGANHAVAPSGVLEKDLVLELAQRVQLKLGEQAIDVQVALTRSEDINLRLRERAQLARQMRADAFVSLDFNAFNASARGVEAWVRPRHGGNINFEQDERLAQRLVDAVFQTLQRFDSAAQQRGVKQRALGVLRDEHLGNTAVDHDCAACLLEVEFLDVPAVDALFNTGPNAEAVKDAVAGSIAEAILAEVAVAGELNV